MEGKQREERDRVLRFAIWAVVILFVIGIIVVVFRMSNLRVDASEGQEKLAQIEKAKLEEIDAKIQALEEEERAENEELENRSADEKFAGALIVGDSISQGLYEFGIMDSSLVFAERGFGVSNPESEEVSSAVNQVLEAKPRKLFLALGMNDIVADNCDAEEFVKDYKTILTKLKKELPECVIYVNSVLPANEKKTEKDDRYAVVPEYNEKLKAMCEEEGIVFIDNTSLVQEEYYAEDGIHMSPDYYPEWVNHMAEVAEL